MRPTLIRLETLDGTVKWRNVPDYEHGTLCRAFGLDPASTWFDLPSSVRIGGRDQVGAGTTNGGARGRHINGYVFQGPKGSEPIGILQWVREGERIPDTDPHDKSDFFRLDGR